MVVVRLSKTGQLSLPAAVLRKMGIQGAATLLIQATEDGAVILRPAAAHPVEVYTEARMKEFEALNRRTPAEAVRVRKALARSKR